MYPTLFEENKLLLIDRLEQSYLPATYIPTEYLPLIIPYAGLYYEQDNDFNMLTQHVPLGPFSLWLHDVFARKDIVLCPYAPFHLWALHFMYEDTLRAVTFKTNGFTLEEKQCNLFNLYADMHRVPMFAGQKILSFHINILPSAFMQLVQVYPGLQSLANKRLQKHSSIINEKPYRINAVCNMLIQNIVSCRYIESQARHYLERCCLDLFLNFAQQDAISDEVRIPNEAQARLYHDIFEYLVEHPHQPHTADQVAKMFDMSGVKLATAFRHQFSVGINAFIHMLKMMLAYNSLMQQCVSLKEVAHTAGYKTIDELVREVEKYYNCNIAALRRSM
ncbi:helix-turn-helix domain-containing protein [Chitinophaga pinensis]|uniref:Transcriptional regulator, AraC family n=1 Tax=Chitinophaga pinensis (strain ATCC 43595 / DSM 2588 / LMG 13176 / NBRC 15968 / NCIMB 11800 / UQM 2034) TaxID=485918 RepID=A0A979FYP9_CHIPD|nr:AraC family transcriptional regulator [Chitinophaga pinensis]ACU57569.1 transcriptional regulator, AraC family [Chitinophaga pinensis DSM 2588]